MACPILRTKRKEHTTQASKCSKKDMGSQYAIFFTGFALLNSVFLIPRYLERKRDISGKNSSFSNRTSLAPKFGGGGGRLPLFLAPKFRWFNLVENSLKSFERQ